MYMVIYIYIYKDIYMNTFMTLYTAGNVDNTSTSIHAKKYISLESYVMAPIATGIRLTWVV